MQNPRYFILCLLIVSSIAEANVPRPSQVETMDIRATTRDLLTLPGENRIRIFQQTGTDLKTLEPIAFDESAHHDLRWRALTAMAYAKDPQTSSVLERALKSNHWFMRNAALIALMKVDRVKAESWSEKLLEDPSLIVRTAAVKNLTDLRSTSAQASLWRALDDRRNFRGQKSLWIRRHILEALAENSAPGDEMKFVSVLQTTDSELYPAAIKGLNRLAADQVKNGTIKEQRQSWLAWWQVNQSKKL